MKKKPESWLLLEAPKKAETYELLLKKSTGTFSGILLRNGLGLNPLLLFQSFPDRSIQPGLFIHGRDMNLTALLSFVGSGIQLGVRRVFVGDPFPVKGVKPVSPMDGPLLAKELKKEFGHQIQLGTLNRMSHPNDFLLLEKYFEAGVSEVAAPRKISRRRLFGVTQPPTKRETQTTESTVPQNANGNSFTPKIETWIWEKHFPRGKDEKNNLLVDFAEIPEERILRQFERK